MKSIYKVFAIIFIPFALVAAIIFSYSHTKLADSANRQLIEEMKNKWVILADFPLESSFNQKLHKRIRKISQETQLRITLINKHGAVIDDSYLTPAEILKLENHLKRPEIKDAIYKENGDSVRFSSSTNTKMIYYAQRLNGDLILRIAYPLTYLESLNSEFTRLNLSLFLFYFLITGIIAIYFARRISTPLLRMDRIVEIIEEGKTNIHFPEFNDPTMAKISALIYRIYKAMNAKRQELTREQEKLNYTFSILEEGIILLDENNKILHFNQKAELLLGVKLRVEQEISSEIENFELVNFFQTILSSTENKKWKAIECQGKIMSVGLKIINSQKLIAFSDVTEEALYDRYKAELVGNISHELRTPLSMIMGYAETILEDPEMPVNIVRDFLGKIYKGSQRLNWVIDDILELHRIEMLGSNIKVTEAVEIEDLVADLKASFVKTEDKQIKYYVGEFSVMIGYEHIMSVLSNLISNAIKYSTGDLIKVSIRLAGDTLKLAVEDQGPAIPVEDRERIFERFYTVSGSRNRKKSGTGLGLSIVKHIANIYSGSIQHEESRNRGNIFQVELKEKK